MGNMTLIVSLLAILQAISIKIACKDICDPIIACEMKKEEQVYQAAKVLRSGNILPVESHHRTSAEVSPFHYPIVCHTWIG